FELEVCDVPQLSVDVIREVATHRILVIPTDEPRVVRQREVLHRRAVRVTLCGCWGVAFCTTSGRVGDGTGVAVCSALAAGAVPIAMAATAAIPSPVATARIP